MTDLVVSLASISLYFSILIRFYYLQELIVGVKQGHSIPSDSEEKQYPSAQHFHTVGFEDQSDITHQSESKQSHLILDDEEAHEKQKSVTS